MNDQNQRRSFDLLPRSRKNKEDLHVETAAGPPPKTTHSPSKPAAHRPVMSPKRQKLTSRLSIRSFHRSRSYSAAQFLEEAAHKDDDVFTSPSSVISQASLEEEGEEDSSNANPFLTPAEAGLAAARRRLSHHGLLGFATGDEVRPDLTYSGRWEFDEDLAKRHSQWIGRDARARDVIQHNLKRHLDAADAARLAACPDAHRMWAAAEAATANAVAGVVHGLLSAVHDYTSADQVCCELAALNAQLQRLGPAAAPETLLVLFAYCAMHALDRLIFRHSLPLLHPSTWSLDTLRQHEVLWDSVFDELFDLESDWRFRLDGEDVIITINNTDEAEEKEGGEEEEYRIPAPTLFAEFKLLAVDGYDAWLDGHPTHFQKCGAKCPNRTSTSGGGGIHYRTTDATEPTAKDVADTLAKAFKDRDMDMDMDWYRPPEKRGKKKDDGDGERKPQPQPQTNGTGTGTGTGTTPVTPSKPASIT